MAIKRRNKKEAKLCVLRENKMTLCDHIEDVYAFLDIRDEDGFNTVYMRPEEKEPWPLMSILIKDDMAFVQVVPEDFHQGYISLSDFSQGLDYENGKTVFREGKRDVDVQNMYVISCGTLREVVNEFFQTGKLPECIMWT